MIRSAVWQGSVTGLLEEVAGLVRRVEGLDDTLRTAQPKHLAVQDGVAVRIRTASCEELLRQRTRAAGSRMIRELLPKPSRSSCLMLCSCPVGCCTHFVLLPVAGSDTAWQCYVFTMTNSEYLRPRKWSSKSTANSRRLISWIIYQQRLMLLNCTLRDLTS